MAGRVIFNIFVEGNWSKFLFNRLLILDDILYLDCNHNYLFPLSAADSTTMKTDLLACLGNTKEKIKTDSKSRVSFPRALNNSKACLP